LSLWCALPVVNPYLHVSALALIREPRLDQIETSRHLRVKIFSDGHIHC